MKVLLFMQFTLIVQLVWAAEFDFSQLKANTKRDFKEAQVIEEGDKMQLKLRPVEDEDSLIVRQNGEKEFKIALRRAR